MALCPTRSILTKWQTSACSLQVRGQMWKIMTWFYTWMIVESYLQVSTRRFTHLRHLIWDAKDLFGAPRNRQLLFRWDSTPTCICDKYIKLYMYKYVYMSMYVHILYANLTIVSSCDISPDIRRSKDDSIATWYPLFYWGGVYQKSQIQHNCEICFMGSRLVVVSMRKTYKYRMQLYIFCLVLWWSMFVLKLFPMLYYCHLSN